MGKECGDTGNNQPIIAYGRYSCYRNKCKKNDDFNSEIVFWNNKNKYLVNC